MRIGCRKCGFLPRLAASRNSKVLNASRGGVLVINAIHKSPFNYPSPVRAGLLKLRVFRDDIPLTVRLPIFASITSDQERL